MSIWLIIGLVAIYAWCINVGGDFRVTPEYIARIAASEGSIDDYEWEHPIL